MQELVRRCLVQKVSDEYYLRDAVHEYLALTVSSKGQQPLRLAASRQARYLATTRILSADADLEDVSEGGLAHLSALWTSLMNINGEIDAKQEYMGELENISKSRPWFHVGRLLELLVRECEKSASVGIHGNPSAAGSAS